MATSTESLAARLASATGAQARPAEAADGVAGVAAGVVIEPTSEEQVAAVLALADGEGLKVLPRGGGSQLNFGFPPEAADIILSTASLRGVLDYNPHDLTVTVLAGTPLAELQQVLGRFGQFLALDPALAPAATIGGLVATNATGPLRLRYGGVRDQIIGVRVVTADGTIAKGGGKVVKNVAGYDLPKLFTGSLATLGVIVTATFRLYPLPAAARSVVVGASEPAHLFALARRVLGTRLEPAAMCVAGDTADADGTTLGVRFFSVPTAAEGQASRLVELAGDSGASAQVLAGEDDERFWQTCLRELTPQPQRSDSLLLKVNVLPTEVARWIERLAALAAERRLAATYAAQVGHGIIFVRLAGNAEALAGAIEPLREAAGPVPEQGSLVVWDAPPEATQRVDVWGPSPALELMRRVKSAFDPHTTLNPGRFIGRI
jgi:glycolate oxidase FAD binding subunit